MIIYLNQLYDLEKVLEKDGYIQNPETLAMYIFESEKKNVFCFILLSIVLRGQEITQAVLEGRQMLNHN